MKKHRLGCLVQEAIFENPESETADFGIIPYISELYLEVST